MPLLTTYWIGFFIPALVAGALVGAIARTMRVWFWTTAVLVAATVYLAIGHQPHL